MPEEVNIDELLDLQSDEERTQKLKVSALKILMKKLLKKSELFVTIMVYFN